MEYYIVNSINGFVNNVLRSKEQEDKKEAQEIVEFLERFKTEQIQKIDTSDEEVFIGLEGGAYVDVFHDEEKGDYLLAIKTKDGKVLSSVGNTILKGYVEYLFRELQEALS